MPSRPSHVDAAGRDGLQGCFGTWQARAPFRVPGDVGLKSSMIMILLM